MAQSVRLGDVAAGGADHHGKLGLVVHARRHVRMQLNRSLRPDDGAGRLGEDRRVVIDLGAFDRADSNPT